MKPTLPVKNIIRLNWLLLITFTAIVSMYLFFLLEESPAHKLLYTLLTAMGIGLVAFANLAILILLSRKLDLRTRQFRLYRLLLTYLASAAIYLALDPVFGSISPTEKLYPFPVYTSIFIVSSLVVNTIILMLQDFVLLQNEKSDADLEVARLKTAHAEAANLLLKQQIHPHFLFNSLNTLKALYRTDVNTADTYIVRLASFLRASIVDHSARLTRLEDEINLLTDYFTMQKIRFGEAVNCVIDVPEHLQKNFNLPAFSLQPLLENALKHNILTLASPLTVRVFCMDGRIVVCNNLQKTKVKASSTNHGLANLAERCRLLSGDELRIIEDGASFSVSIKLLPDEYCNY